MSFTFKNFFNKVSNDNRIFTKEDIKNMSSKEFQRNEKAIDYQMENLGIPTNSELKNRNDAVFVHEYLREDGTFVKAHYRSKPDNAGNNTFTVNFWNLNPTVNMNEIDEYNLLKAGNKWYNAIHHNYPDAYKLYDMYLTKPQNILSTDEYRYLAPSTSYMLNKQFNLTGEKYVPEHWSGFAFSKDSGISENLSNSQELKDKIKTKYIISGYKFENNQIEIKLDKSNFRLAYGTSTILNPKVKDGYFTGVLFDKYDFKLKAPHSWLDIVGDASYLMGLDRKFYILVPIKFKW